MAKLLVPQAAAAIWRVLWALVCLLFSPCYAFLEYLSYSVYKQWCLRHVLFFFPARSFSSVGHLACAGGARQIVSSCFSFICFILLFRSVFFVCVFSLIAFLRFSISHVAGVPGGLVDGPRAYEDQFRGLKSHRVHARGLFLQKNKLISGKRESVS